MNSFINNNRSIKSQVITFMGVSIALMILVISIITTKGVSQQYKSFMLENAVHIAQGFASQSVFPLLSASTENAQAAMAQVTGFKSVNAARLLFPNNNVFFSSGAFPAKKSGTAYQFNNAVAITEFNDYWLVRTSIVISSEDEEMPESQLELQELVSVKEIIGYAEIIYSKEVLQNAQINVALLTSLIGGFSILVLSIILRLGLTRLFKPLNALADTMSQTTDTGKHLIAHISGAKEIRNMARTYNNMMTVLDQQENALKSHRDQLESDVALRTQALVHARDAALTASRHKSEFIANISHELRTPIQSIIGYGELVNEELELSGNFELLEDMDKINDNASRLLALINSLLDLAKIEAGKVDVNLSEVDINGIINAVTNTITPIAKHNNNVFTVENNSTVDTLTLDKEKFEQVLLNLLSNACKFTTNGQISLTISQDKHHRLFTIKDNGIGMTKKQLSYIFEEFRQVDSSEVRRFSGTGLGLAITKRFVELMQGKITVNSEKGVGSEFCISLPIEPTSQNSTQ